MEDLGTLMCAVTNQRRWYKKPKLPADHYLAIQILKVLSKVNTYHVVSTADVPSRVFKSAALAPGEQPASYVDA